MVSSNYRNSKKSGDPLIDRIAQRCHEARKREERQEGIRRGIEGGIRANQNGVLALPLIAVAILAVAIVSAIWDEIHELVQSTRKRKRRKKGTRSRVKEYIHEV